MSTRAVTLTGDAFVILEEGLQRAALVMGLPKACRPVAYDRASRALVVNDPHIFQAEVPDVVEAALTATPAEELPPPPEVTPANVSEVNESGTAGEVVSPVVPPEATPAS